MLCKRSHLPAALALTLLASPEVLRAVDYNNAAGTQWWGTAGNWLASPPNGADTVARMVTSGTAANQILLLADATGADASFTVGTFSIGSTGGSAAQHYQLNNVASGTQRLVFDVASGNATLTFANIFANATMSVNTGLTLNDNLLVNVNRGGAIHNLNGQISSGVAGTGITFNVVNNGLIRIGAANNYTGATTINGTGGVVQLVNGGDRLATGTTLTINGGVAAGGVLDLNTRNQKVAGLSGGSGDFKGSVTNNAAGTGTATLTVESTSVSSTFAGIIKNGTTAKVALTKAGAGTSLTLTGANTYTGATIVNGGSLIVDGSLASGSAVSVNAGGTLGGSGTIGGTTVLAASARLSAGVNSAATLTFSGTLDVAAAANDSAAFVFDLGTSSDKIIASSLLLGSNVIDAADFSFSAGSGFTDGQIYTLFEGSSITGTFVSFTVNDIGGSGISGLVSIAGNNVILTTSAISEPSTYAALLGAAGLTLAVTRRSRPRHG
ncbi:MAG: autotransporter [Rariglobus sp.]|jgi:autotransporter-associated beta strand protein|nr:autotransporter [Rariglobus sp.]